MIKVKEVDYPNCPPKILAAKQQGIGTFVVTLNLEPPEGDSGNPSCSRPWSKTPMRPNQVPVAHSSPGLFLLQY
jgi:hypothetical protein